MLDSGSDCASSRGQLVHKKTKVKRTSIFSSTEFLIREHFNNFHIFSNNIYQTVSPQPLCPKSVSVKANCTWKGIMDDIRKMKESGTYLDVKGSGDSTLGEESAQLSISRENV